MKYMGIVRLLGITLIIALAISLLTVYTEVGLSESLEIAALATLVGVTMVYARYTRKMSKEMKKQADIMLAGQYNAVAPVIKLIAGQASGGQILIEWENVGLGPALNFYCWIEDREHPQLRSQGKMIYRSVIPSEHSLKDKAIIENEYFQTGIEDYKLGRESGYVRAQYQGIHGKEKFYETCLFFSSPNRSKIEYFEVGREAGAIFDS